VAKKSASFIDLHAEKIALGIGAAIMIGGVVFGLGGGRFSVNGHGPGEICSGVGEAADQTRQAVQNARPESLKPPTETGGGKDPVAQLAEWFGNKAVGVFKIAGVSDTLPRTQPYTNPYVPLVAAGNGTKRHLAKIVAPDIPLVTSGRSGFDFPTEISALEVFDGKTRGGGKPVERSWVTVAAQIDLVRQDANFRSEEYPEGSYLEIVQVHLQRKDLTDPRRGWEEIETYLPFKPPNRPSLVSATGANTMEGVDKFRRLIDGTQEYISRTKLPSEGVELPQIPFLDEPPKAGTSQTPEEAEQEASSRIRKWVDRARSAIAGKRPFKDIDLDAAYILARAGAGTLGAKEAESNKAKQLLTEVKAKLPKSRRNDLQEQTHSPDRLMPIVAHDLDVQPGHTYVYRIRYEVFNVYAGNPGELANPEDALKLTVFSGWSPVSRPVEVTSDTYFYLSKSDRAKKEVTVTVFKVSKRETKRQDYRVHVGEPIGRKERLGAKTNFSTGNTCIDIDFDRLVDGQKDVSMIYTESDGSLRERLLSRDKKDKVFQKLSAPRAVAAK
jgi:hypothetical protein